MVNINNNTGKDFCKVFPNPCSDEVSFSFPIKTAGNVIVNLFDTNGKIIQIVEDYYAPSSACLINLNIKGLKDGIYFYQLITPDKTIDGKISVIR